MPRTATLAVLLAFTTATIWGQGSVTIFGTVTDTAGAVIPNVSTKVANSQTGALRTALSGPIGAYSVEGQASGFKVFTAADIHVQVNENRSGKASGSSTGRSSSIC